MIDTTLIRRKLGELETCIHTLERLRGYSLKELQEDRAKAWSVEHGLQIAVQTVIDTGNNILAALGEHEIEDYVDVIDKLGEQGVIPKAFSQSIRGMAGFRNILVHEYAAVDLTKVYHVLQNQLDDFRQFAKHIDAYLAICSKNGA
ncbi:MAG: DUF86 domain-containing protein [Nitrospirae bacterium]|nr:DUF86 domain-containing protein [Nitrospirota bacterium]